MPTIETDSPGVILLPNTWLDRISPLGETDIAYERRLSDSSSEESLGEEFLEDERPTCRRL
jgi:hypothetical protein